MKKVVSMVLAVIIASTFSFAQTDSLMLKEVVVTGARSVSDVRHLPMTVTIINHTTLTEQQQPSLLPTIMQHVPGLFITSRSMMGFGVSTGAAGGINMRGLTGGAGQMLVLIDGHPQYNGIYGHPISDSYQSLMAERVEVLRGPASVLYGSNAMGGVINIVTHQMDRDGAHTHLNLGAGSYGTVQTEVMNQTRKGRFSSTIAAQYNRTDNHRPHMDFEQNGIYGKLGYDLSEAWKMYADADVTHFNASYPGSTSEPVFGAEQWITRGVVSATLENHYRHISGAISVYSNFGNHKIDDGTKKEGTFNSRYFRSEDSQSGISAYQIFNPFAGNHITVGFDYQNIYGKAYYTDKVTDTVINTSNKQSGESDRNEVAAYIDFRQDILQWLTFDMGIRWDHHSVVGTEWIPQAGIVVRPTENSEVKTMVGKGFRNPTMREMYLYPPSNDSLRAERIWNYELSWRQRLSRFNYGFNLFYLRGDNMIQTIERRNVNTGKVENYGMEMEATYRFDDFFSLTTNHSFLHMKYPILAAPKYKGFVGVDYRYHRLGAVVGLQAIRGLYTKIGEEKKTENVALLDATVSYYLSDNLRLWVRGENLLGQKYELNEGYPMPRATFMAGVNVSF